MQNKIRLQKYIADQGICSRRKAEELIRLGKVKLNGKIIKEMGTKIDPKSDKVEVVPTVLATNPSRPSQSHIRNTKNSSVSLQSSHGEKIYIVLNKPVDYITSTTNEQGKSVLDLLTKENNVGRDKREPRTRVYPVGRLDKDSEGLVLLTNDGELTNQLTHPRHEHEKEYEVTIDKALSRDAKNILSKGMKIDNEVMQGIKIVKEIKKGRRVIVKVTLKEGKNRQRKKMRL